MKKFLYLLVCVGALFSPAYSIGLEPPKTHVIPNITIDGAAEIVPYGEMIQLSVKADSEPDNVVIIKYDWQIFDANQTKKRVYISPDGKTVLFAAGVKPTKFLVVLDAVYTFADKDEKGTITDVKTITTGVLSTEVKVGSDDPPPPDPDKPEPPKPPVPKPFPDSPLGIVKPSVDAVNEMKSAQKAEAAKALAVEYNNIKNKIAAQGITSLSDAYSQLKAATGPAITKAGGDLTEWQIWDNKVRKVVYGLYLDKKLGQVTDYIGVFSEIANSLEYVAEQK